MKSISLSLSHGPEFLDVILTFLLWIVYKFSICLIFRKDTRYEIVYSIVFIKNPIHSCSIKSRVYKVLRELQSRVIMVKALF